VPGRVGRLREGFNFNCCIARTRFLAFEDVPSGISITEYYGVYLLEKKAVQRCFTFYNISMLHLVSIRLSYRKGRLQNTMII